MKKAQKVFYKELANKLGLDLNTVETVLNGFEKYAIEELKAGNSIQWTGTMTLSVKDRAARVGRNPKTGEAINIPAKRVGHIKVGSNLRDLKS